MDHRQTRFFCLTSALAAALVCAALLALTACGSDSAQAPAATPAPEKTEKAGVAVVTPEPTATPEPAWLHEPVDFLGQDALKTAVQYALKTDDDEISGAALASVEELILVDGANISDLAPLAHAESLGTLVVIDGAMDLAPLAELANLKRLTLTGGHFGDLTRVAVLPHLEELNLFHYDTGDLTPLIGLTKLHTLRLGNHKNFAYTGLEQLTGLKTLLIADRSRNDLSRLTHLKNLESLTIWPCKQRDLAWIADMQNLTELHLDMRTDGDLTPLEKLTGLTKLSVNFESGRLLDPMWLSKLVGLEELYLRGAYFGELAALKDIRGLRRLAVDDIRISLDLTQMPDFPELTDLEIRNCSVMCTGELARYPKLTRFVLYHGELDQHRPIYELTNLTSLILRPVPAGGYRTLGGVEWIAGLTNLEELDWGGRAGDLTQLEALSKLKKLNLDGAKIKDLTPLTALTNLETLDVSNNRFSRIPDLSALTKLKSFRLVGSRINDFSGLATSASLAHATLQGDRIKDPAQLAQAKGLYDVALSDEIGNARQAEKLIAAQQTVTDALRASHAYANTADSRAVLDRFRLNSYLHEPYYGSPDWYPLLERTY